MVVVALLDSGKVKLLSVKQQFLCIVCCDYYSLDYYSLIDIRFIALYSRYHKIAEHCLDKFVKR